MLAEADARRITDKIIKWAGPYGEVETILTNSASSLTRYANNVITQNVREGEIVTLAIRLIKGGKTSRAVINQVNDKSLKAAIARAAAGLKYQEKDKAILTLTPRQRYSPTSGYVRATASVTPSERARAVKDAVSEIARAGLEGSGIFSNDVTSITLANSNRLFAFHVETSAEFTCTVMTADSSARESKTTKDVGQIDAVRLARKAVEKARRAQGPIALPAGAYTVILEPAAVVHLLAFLAFRGFGALDYQEGRSFLSGKLGTRIVGKNITITDDVYHPLIQGMPFDLEGMPRRKVTLIDKGIARSLVYDRLTARKDKTRSTGHGLAQPNPHGPMPASLVLQPGDSSVAEMVASTERGLLVSEFHYTNLVEPMKMVLTGMTRNGLYLIENGEVTRGVRNMRFTESLLRALSNVELVSREAEFIGVFFGGGFVVPALKIGGFTFSSETKF